MALAGIHHDTADAIGELTSAGLLRDRGLIAGEWVAADTGATFAVTDPSTGETIIGGITA